MNWRYRYLNHSLGLLLLFLVQSFLSQRSWYQLSHLRFFHGRLVTFHVAAAEAIFIGGRFVHWLGVLPLPLVQGHVDVVVERRTSASVVDWCDVRPVVVILV